MGISSAPFRQRLLLYAVVMTAVFGAAGIFSEYGYYDDFWQLYFYQHGKYDFPTAIFYQCGRPLQDLLSRPLFTGISGIHGLALIRGLNLLGMIAFGGLLMRLLERRGFGGWTALALALLATLVPSTGIIAGWACMVHAPFALVVSLLAGWGCLAALERSGISTTRRILSCVLGGLGVVIAESSYQPCAGAFLLPFLADLVQRPGDRAANRRALAGMAVFSLGMLAYYGLYKLSIALWIGEGWFTARAQMGDNLLQQAVYYCTEVIVQLASFWEVFRTARPAPGMELVLDRALNPAVAIVVLALVAYGWIRPVLDGWKRLDNWLPGLLGAAALALMLAPAILSSEQYFNFRLFPVCYAAIVLFAAAGLRPLCPLAAILLVPWFAFQSWRHVRHDLVEPVRNEYAVLKQAILAEFDSYPPALVYVAPAAEYTPLLLSRTRVADYGIPLATLPYGPQYVFKLLLNERLTGSLRHPPSDDVQVLVVEADRYIPDDWAHALRADLLFDGSSHPPVDTGRLFTPHPVFGDVVQHANDWIHSPKYGYLNPARFPHLRHLLLGWMYYYPEYNYIEFEHPQLGRLSSHFGDFHYWKDADGGYHTLEVRDGMYRLISYRP